MRTYILTSTLAAAVVATAAGQTPPPGQQGERTGTTTITGCLYNENDVAGRRANVAERAGIGEDYIIAVAGAGGAADAMYKVEDIDDERLRAHVGKRVELVGRIDDDDDDDDRATGTSGADRSVGPDRIELPEFEAASIREVSGSCPAKPAAGEAAAAVSGTAGASQTQSATATDTETQTHTAPVTETPSHPAAQPQPQPQPQPQAPVTQAPTYPQTSPAPAQTITLSGCLYRERDVPGRSPNVAERAGILEDYILTDASVMGAAGEAGATGTSGAAPAIGRMFKVEHVADEKLAGFVGKRVEVTGTIDAEENEMRQAGTAGTSGTTQDRSVGPDRIELPEFEAASIREVAGSCPAQPQR